MREALTTHPQGNDLGARSAKSMKALAQRVLQDDACPIETVRAVLQGTLKALFGIGEIDRWVDFGA